QNYQQNAIDKTKGVESKDMPKSWWNKHEIKIQYHDEWRKKGKHDVLVKADTPEVIKLKQYQRSILADRKTYFMIYIYSDEMAKWKKYIDAVDRNCIRRFGYKYNDLLEMNDNSSVEEYTAFINEVKKQSPCLLSNSVMN